MSLDSHLLFYEDQVCHLTATGGVSFGSVVESPRDDNSDMDLSDLDDSDHEEEKVAEGHVRVAWYPQGVEKVVKENKVILSDRSLMPGDVVRLSGQTEGPKGVCLKIKITSENKVIDADQVVSNVQSHRLEPVVPLTQDVHIYFNGWVGRIRDVSSDLILQKLNTDNEDNIRVFEGNALQELDTRWEESFFDPLDYYPGQILKCPERIWKKGRPLEASSVKPSAKARKKKIVYKTKILDIVTERLKIHWLCRSFCETGPMEPPSPLITSDEFKNIKPLDVLYPCTLQLSDVSYLTIKEEDVTMSKKEWLQLQKQKLGVATKMEIQDTVSKIPDKKPESESKCDADSDSDFESESEPEEKKAPPKRRWGKKGRKKTKLLRKTQKTKNEVKVKPGDKVMVETLCTNSQVHVLWQDGTIQESVPSVNLVPVHHLDDHEYFVGDFVVKSGEEKGCDMEYGVVERVDHRERTAVVKWFKPYTTEKEPVLLSESECPVYELSDHKDYQFNAGCVVVKVPNSRKSDSGQANSDISDTELVGQFLEQRQNGQLLVSWLDGHESLCWPQEILNAGINDDEDDDDSFTSSHDGSDDSWETQSEESLVQVSFSDIEDKDVISMECNDVVPEMETRSEDQKQMQNGEGPFATKLEFVEKACATHKFYSRTLLPNQPKKFLQACRSELARLGNSLPNGIKVVAYEDRLDLFSVMIEGPKNTPYEDGLFFFELILSSDYPISPPEVHYLPFCSDRLNPNLYADGKVCLSLLGTWTGKGSETWTHNSNILQLLVSIQGLILVGEPYFNEAGYEKHRSSSEGRQNSRNYNEMVILKVIQSLTNISQRPPLPFQKEVKEFVQEKADRLINRLESWMNSEGASSETQPDFPLFPLSKGFCISIRTAIEQLKKAKDEIKVGKN